MRIYLERLAKGFNGREEPEKERCREEANQRDEEEQEEAPPRAEAARFAMESLGIREQFLEKSPSLLSPSRLSMGSRRREAAETARPQSLRLKGGFWALNWKERIFVERQNNKKVILSPRERTLFLLK